MNKFNIKKLVMAGVCLALCFILPFLSGQVPAIGNKLSPMHIPVLICGFICGWQYGAVIGFIAPLLRYLLFGMPPIMPTGLCMAFELAAYGAFAGIFYKLLKKTVANVYLSLLLAMLLGRFVWGLAALIVYRFAAIDFSFNIFLTAAFLNAVPGIICHILLVPAIVLGLKQAGLIENN